MQKTSSCGQLDNLRKIAPPFNANSGAGDSFKNTAFKNTASELGRRLCNNSGTPVAGLSSVGLLRRQIVAQGELQLGVLHELTENLRAREQKLDPENNLSLFEWPSVQPPASILAGGSSLQYRIPKPLGSAKLVLARLYAEKYGISIVCQFEGQNAAGVVDALIEQVRKAKGKPVGFVVPARPPGQWPGLFNFRGHVVPLVIQQTKSGFNVLNLDSLGNNSPYYQQFLDVFKERMKASGARVLRYGLVSTRRQADKQSCHTDALQILKDTLCVLQKTRNTNCLDMFEKNGERLRLPSCLQKTNQRHKALFEDNFDAATLLQPERVATLWGDKSLTIGQHRYKYTAELGARKSNYFLAVKAFYNARKVLEQLEKVSNTGAHQIEF